MPEGIQPKFNQGVVKGNLGKTDRKIKKICGWKEEIGVFKSNLLKQGKLRHGFNVSGFPFAALNNLAIWVLINTFSYNSFL